MRPLAAALAALLCAPAALTAQDGARDWTRSFVSTAGESTVWGPEGSFSPCAGPDGGSPAPLDVRCTFSSTGRTESGGIGAMQMRASATAGGALHAYTHVGVLTTTTDMGAHARSVAYAYDPIFFSGYVPAWLRVTAVLHGNAVASPYPCTPTPHCGSNGGDDVPPDAAVGELHVVGGDWERIVVSDADAPAQRTVTWDFPVWLQQATEGGVPYFHFSMTLVAQGFARPGTFATADFGNTAWIASIRAVSAEGCDLAADGCDVTARVRADGVWAASGASYGGFTTDAPTTTTPEPATLALVGVGVAALAARARRRA